MKMFIRATGNISPQQTFGNVPFLAEAVEYTGNRLSCIEPDYKDIIDPKMIRRMSRIIKMGVAAATACLKESGVEKPDAIITGTAYGCLQDTDLFLTKMVEQNEELLTPTAFIQSTHNTIGAQIGLMLKSNNYNNAFVHRGFSFESALLDGVMLLMENAASNFLVGAVDELTDNSYAILNRFGLYKQKPLSNLDLYKTNSRGTIAGEGSSFFLIAKEESVNDYAQLNGMSTFYKPKDIAETGNQITAFLAAQAVTMDDIDLVITGKNGNAKDDVVYNHLALSVFKAATLANYKHLCGEYPTSTAFALWLAAQIIKTGTIPAVLNIDNPGKVIKKILIHNHYQDTHHTLLLLSAC
ncbi:MAG: beta-ketoacyl synthase chain length factor [Ferruginibacter sp.]